MFSIEISFYEVLLINVTDDYYIYFEYSDIISFTHLYLSSHILAAQHTLYTHAHKRNVWNEMLLTSFQGVYVADVKHISRPQRSL